MSRTRYRCATLRLLLPCDRIRHGLPWPDGQEMNLKPDDKALWILADNHHDEIVTLAMTFAIPTIVKPKPARARVIPFSPSDIGTGVLG